MARFTHRNLADAAARIRRAPARTKEANRASVGDVAQTIGLHRTAIGALKSAELRGRAIVIGTASHPIRAVPAPVARRRLDEFLGVRHQPGANKRKTKSLGADNIPGPTLLRSNFGDYPRRSAAARYRAGGERCPGRGHIRIRVPPNYTGRAISNSVPLVTFLHGRPGY
jgi:hypothetical protein